MTEENKSMINKILDLINGKKTSIAVIIGAILTFTLGRDMIAADTANLISTILVALGISANLVNANTESKRPVNGPLEIK